MTIREVIDRVDRLKANQYNQAQKIVWLSACDAQIYRSIFLTHELPEGAPKFFVAYEEGDLDKELLVGPPYDAVYDYWLQSQIDFYNKEMGNYNNTKILYNNAYAGYEAWHNSTYMPVQRVTHIKL